MRLILVRHGETIWNEEGRIQGFTNIGLSERGKEQIKKVAQALSKERVTAIYSSPLKRAMDTAEAIAQFHDLEVIPDPDLREINVGDLEGLSLEELRNNHSDFLEEWKEGKGSLSMPGGESLEEVQERAWRAIQRITVKHPEGVVIVVSHVFTILTTICRALKLELPCFRRLRQDVGAISILHFGEQGTSLVLFNDTCHLGSMNV